jgi:hypothetical protein
MKLLLQVPYIASLRAFLQSGFLDFVMEQGVALSLVAPTRPRRDLERFLERHDGRVAFTEQQTLFPRDLGTRVRRRWRFMLHGLSLELLRNENVTFRRQANRHPWPVRLVCRTPGVESLLRGIYPRLDYVVPGNRSMLTLVRTARPDVVAAVGSLSDEVEIDVFRSARALGLPSAMIVHSWDNPAGRATPPIQPSRWIVWGEEMAGHVGRYHRVPPDRIEVTGAVQFNMYSDVALAACDRASFLRDIGLDPRREVLLYAPSHVYRSYSDIPALRLLLEYVRTHRAVQLWFRPHPHTRELPEVLAFVRDHGIFLDPSFSAFLADGGYERRELPELRFYPHMLNAADVVVTNASTMSLEAAIVGRPLVIIGFDCPPDGVTDVRLSIVEVLQHPPVMPLQSQEAVIMVRRSEDFFAAIDRARALRHSAPGALAALRQCANRIAAVSDGKVFERVFGALRAMRRPGA